MISNHDANRMRLYGGERASSNSSNGPKWTSSISDLLVNRNNTMRYPGGVSQSHQTSQNQLLSHQGQPASAGDGGGRLMMKLMNMGTQNYHQPSASAAIIGGGAPSGAHTFDHPRLSGSRDDQKRLALDECTNYLQQKTIQQHLPSAISNIINSNRSGSSSGLQVPQPSGQSQSTSNAAKKYQAFKFNLTLKALNQQKGVEPPPPAQALQQQFYQAPSEVAEQDSEETEAVVINEKHRKQMQGATRGPSQLAMKQHLKQMIKSYEDQPIRPDQEQPLPADDNKHRGSSKSGKPLDKKVGEMEERQKIFEEEIIKRVKEIQNYTKTLHMHLKKLQQSHAKKGEELQGAKDQIMQLREAAKAEVTEQSVSDMMDKRLQLLDEETALKVDQLELKLTKDYEAKMSRLGKQQATEVSQRIASVKEEILGMVGEELTQSFKGEIMKLVGEKIRDAQKTNERTAAEFRELLEIKGQSIDELINEQANQLRDSTSKFEKVQKQIKESKAASEDLISQVGETLRQEIESMRKRVMKDLKAEIDGKQYSTQGDLTEATAVLASQIAAIQASQASKPQGTFEDITSMIQSKLKSFEQNIEERLTSVESEVASVKSRAQASDDKLKSIQDAYLQLKGHLTSQTGINDERIGQIEANVQRQQEELEMQLAQLTEQVNTLQHAPPQQQEVDTDQLTEQVLQQLAPDFNALSENQSSLQQQFEALKQQLSQKLMRSELQEIKQDIDEEIRSLGKLFKKAEERFTNIEGNASKLKSESDQRFDEIDSRIQEVQAHDAQAQEAIQEQIAQLAKGLEDTKAGLSLEIQKIAEKQTQIERRPNSPAANVGASDLFQIEATVQAHQEEVGNALHALHEAVLGLKKEEFVSKAALEKHMKALKDEFEASIRLQLSGIMQKQTEQSTALKENASTVTHLTQLQDSLERKLESTDLQVDTLDTELKALQSLATAKFDSLSLHQADIQSVSVSLQAYQNEQGKLHEGQNLLIKRLENEIAHISGLINESSATNEDLQNQWENITREQTDLQKKISEVDAKLETAVLKLQENTLQAVQQVSQESKVAIGANELIVKAHSQKISQLEEAIAKIAFDKPRIQESPQLIQRQGHFLEDLSEVASSNQNFGHGDGEIFNGRQSMSSASMLSNRMMTPLHHRGPQFQYNSQGQRQQTSPDHPEPSPNQQEFLVNKKASVHQGVGSAPSMGSPDLRGMNAGSPEREIQEEAEEIPMQKMNISIESKEEDKQSPQRSYRSNQMHAHKSERSQSHLGERASMPTRSPMDRSNSEEDENRYQEEVLESLQQVSEVGSEPEEEEKEPVVRHHPPIESENVENDDALAHMLSPSHVKHTQINQHTQNPHFVAFESDEEDSQQYDLLPITSMSRRGSNAHANPPPPNANAGPTNLLVNSRNRYYESASGGEEEEKVLFGQHQPEVQQEAAPVQNDFLSERSSQPSVIENDNREEDSLNEEEGQDGALNFNDGAPFEAPSSSRFEEEKRAHASRGSFNGVLQPNNEDEDNEFQAIQHETFSSHRSSEANSDNRSGSLNIDHNHDNIDENDEGDQGVPGPNDHSSDPVFAQAHSAILRESSRSDALDLSSEQRPVNAEDDWNLEDADERSDLDEPSEEAKNESDDEREVKLKQSEVVADMIVEAEIMKCIQAVFSLRSRVSSK